MHTRFVSCCASQGGSARHRRVTQAKNLFMILSLDCTPRVPCCTISGRGLAEVSSRAFSHHPIRTRQGVSPQSLSTNHGGMLDANPPTSQNPGRPPGRAEPTSGFGLFGATRLSLRLSPRRLSILWHTQRAALLPELYLKGATQPRDELEPHSD